MNSRIKHLLGSKQVIFKNNSWNKLYFIWHKIINYDFCPRILNKYYNWNKYGCMLWVFTATELMSVLCLKQMFIWYVGWAAILLRVPAFAEGHEVQSICNISLLPLLSDWTLMLWLIYWTPLVITFNFHSRFEDGTVSFLDIIAVNHGFDALERITGQ